MQTNLTTRQTRQVVKHRQTLIEEFKAMTGQVIVGNTASAIRWLNMATVRKDVESILGRKLDAREGKSLLACAEHIEDRELRNALSLAREYQSLRSMTRQFMRNASVTGRLSGRQATILSGVLKDAIDLYEKRNRV